MFIATFSVGIQPHSFPSYVWACFYAARAELESCDRDHMVHEARNICYLALYRKGFPTSGLALLEHDLGEKMIFFSFSLPLNAQQMVHTK